jgi:hypothetical protein
VNLYQKLLNIQLELKAPKNQYSDFGKYNYRSCEDILEALKPLMVKYEVVLLIEDEVVNIGDRYYIKSTAKFIDAEGDPEGLTATAYAREDENKAKMDLSQMTGSASSYARKYALNGLFAIDDTKDSDSTNTHGKEDGKDPTENKSQSKPSAKKDNKKDDDKKVINDNSLATDKQLGYLYKLVEDKKYGPDAMKNYIKTAYKKDSSKALTKQEASEIIEMLNGMGA